MLLDIFREIYSLPKNFEFKRLELEDALIDKFGNLKYNKYEGWTNKSTGEIYPAGYSVDLDTNYSIYSLYSISLSILIFSFLIYRKIPCVNHNTRYFSFQASITSRILFPKTFFLKASNCRLAFAIKFFRQKSTMFVRF